MKRLMLLVFSLALAFAAAAGEWHIETVDSTDGYTSLALDSSGYPHISYYIGYPLNDLKYAYWDGGSWQTETVDSPGYVGTYTSLALDSSGRPHISYYDATNRNLKYARWNGSSWQIQTVDSWKDIGWCTSLALDSSDRPHISYYDVTDKNLKYACWNGGSWQIQTVDTAGDVGYFNSLVLDSSDNPHISYFEDIYFSDGNLKYARWNGSSWQIVTIDIAGDVGGYTSLALDSSDNPHISYCSYGYSRPDDIKYAHWNGSFWQIQTVDSTDGYTSLALDSYDNPHISYYDNHLKYAYWEDGPGVAGAEVSASVNDEGVLVGWTVTGDAPAAVRVLRSAGKDEPVAVSGPLPGEAVRWLDAKVEAGVEYCYWLETTEEDGKVSRFGPTETVNFPGAAREIELSVYPSPAIGAFTVDYTLPENGRISISLYDLSGRRVSTVFDGETAAGRHEFSCDVSALPPGVYLVHLDSGAGTLTRRVVIAR